MCFSYVVKKTGVKGKEKQIFYLSREDKTFYSMWKYFALTNKQRGRQSCHPSIFFSLPVALLTFISRFAPRTIAD